MSRKKVIVAVTGASGAIYARFILQKLNTLKDEIEEVAVVFSKNSIEVVKFELGLNANEITGFNVYDDENFFAPCASGSSNYNIMIVCPCSMGTLGRIAHGYADSLITRSADVMIKENRMLILVPREMPYNLIHIENMKLLINSGVIICPASPSFYSMPQSINDLVQTVTDRVLKIAGFSIKTYEWGNQEF